MALPKISHPVIELEIPSTKTKVKVRPMLTKEEKILLMAKESGQSEDIMAAIKQVVNNCLIPFDKDSKGVDIDELAVFDLEYLFIKLRAYSINPIVKVSYIDNEDQKTYDFEVDLNTIEIKWPDKFKNKEERLIKIDDDVSFQLRYPKASLYSDREFMKTMGADAIDYLARNCVETVYTKNSATKFKDVSVEEQTAFMSELPIKVFDQIREFLGHLPSLYHVINYKNEKGSDRKIEMNTLNDFFTLG